MLPRLVLLVLLVGALAACASPPCKNCSNVAGNYSEEITIEPNHAGCLELGGDGMTAVRVDQPGQGPDITIVSGFGVVFDGKLGEDNSVQLDQNALQTQMGDTGSLSLNGSFTVQDGRATGFKGHYNYMTSSGSCSGDFATTWTR